MNSALVPMLESPAPCMEETHSHAVKSQRISSNKINDLSLDNAAPCETKSSLPVRPDDEANELVLPECNTHCNPDKHDCVDSLKNATLNENVQHSFEAKVSQNSRIENVTVLQPIASESCIDSPDNQTNTNSERYDLSSSSAVSKSGFLEVNPLRSNMSNYTDYSGFTAQNDTKEDDPENEVPRSLNPFKIKHDILSLQATSPLHDVSEVPKSMSKEYKYECLVVNNDKRDPENMKSKYDLSTQSDNSNFVKIIQDREDIQYDDSIQHNKLRAQMKMQDDTLETVDLNIKYLPLEKSTGGVCGFHSNTHDLKDDAEDFTSSEFHKSSTHMATNNNHLDEIDDKRSLFPYETPKSESSDGTHEYKRLHTLQYPQELRYVTQETSIPPQIDAPHNGEYHDPFYMHRYLHYQFTQNHIPKNHYHYCHPYQLPTKFLRRDEQHSNTPSLNKISAQIAKAENQDDGYETSAGDALTPNSHISSPSTSCSSQLSSTIRQLHQPCKSTLANDCDIRTHNHPDSKMILYNENSVKRESKLNFDESYGYKNIEVNNNLRVISPLTKTSLATIRPCFNQSNEDLNEDMRYINHSESARETFNGGLLTAVDHGGSDIHDLDHSAKMLNESPEMTTLTTPLLPVVNAKKRGRKKKIRDENGSRMPCSKPIIQKERKKHDRFNGMSEEEISKRTLPDHLTENLDIIVIGINPGLFAAYKGHYYAGPGNHFWKCLHLSGLINEQMSAEEDYKLMDFGIGFTNMVQRPTKGSADLTRKEIKEGSQILLEKIRRFRPKIAVFNGKLIFEVFSGKKDFLFGRQDDFVDGTNTYMWVMPSSSARCAQLPRAADKVPFYAALKKFRDYLNGLIPHIDESDCVFNDPKYKTCCENEPKSNSLMCKDLTDLRKDNYSNASKNLIGMINNDTNIELNVKTTEKGELDTCSLPLVKKKRGRPKKNKYQINIDEGETLKGDHLSVIGLTSLQASQHCDGSNKTTDLGVLPKKKRGRPKKIRISLLPSNNENTSTDLGNINTTENKVCISQRKEIEISSNGEEKINSNDCVPLARMDSPEDINKIYHHNTSNNQSRLFSSILHSPNTVASSYCSFPTSMDAPSYISSVNLHANSNLNTFYPQYSDQIGQSSRKQVFHSPDSYQPTYGSHSEFTSEIPPMISSEGLSHPHIAVPSICSTGYLRSPRMNELSSEEICYQNPALMDESRKKHPELSRGDFNSYSVNSDNYYPSPSNIPRTSSDNTNESNFQNAYLRLYNTPPVNYPKDRLTDVSAKSLSVLESLVHQIPAFSDVSGLPTHHHLIHDAPLPARILSSSLQPVSNSDNSFVNATTEQFNMNNSATNYTSPVQHQSSLSASPSSSPLLPAAIPTTLTRLTSPQHNCNSHTPYSSSSEYFTSAPTTSITTAFANSSSNDSFKSNTYSAYGPCSFSTNCHSSMASSISNRVDLLTGLSPSTPVHQHTNSSTFGDSENNRPMHTDQSQAFLPVSSLYNAHQMNSFVNHGVYQGCNNVSQNIALVASTSTVSYPSPTQSPVLQPLHPPTSSSLSTLQLPSPNYPHAYNHSSTYTPLHYPASHQHPVSMHHPASATAFLTPHSGVFERLRSDYSYGGF